MFRLKTNRHQSTALLTFCVEKPPVNSRFPSQKASMWKTSWRHMMSQEIHSHYFVMFCCGQARNYIITHTFQSYFTVVRAVRQLPQRKNVNEYDVMYLLMNNYKATTKQTTAKRANNSVGYTVHYITSVDSPFKESVIWRLAWTICRTNSPVIGDLKRTYAHATSILI